MGSDPIIVQNLNFAQHVSIPYDAAISSLYVNALWPSASGGFWCIYEIIFYQTSLREIHLVEISLNGLLVNDSLLCSGTQDSCDSSQFFYVSPSGQFFPYPFIVDQYSNKYYQDSYSENENGLFKYNSMDELMYDIPINDEEGWLWNSEFYIMWSGDFFTKHATQNGLVITKYTLHHDPTCTLQVFTPMPYIGPCPALIQFQAFASDEDNDQLTYHWDFDGDQVYDEPGDDSYTGTPENPTHEFTTDGVHEVFLKVTDNYQGECVSLVTVMIEFE